MAMLALAGIIVSLDAWTDYRQCRRDCGDGRVAAVVRERTDALDAVGNNEGGDQGYVIASAGVAALVLWFVFLGA